MLAICSGKLPAGLQSTLAAKPTKRLVRRWSFRSHVPNCSFAQTWTSIETVIVRAPPCKSSASIRESPSWPRLAPGSQSRCITILRNSRHERSPDLRNIRSLWYLRNSTHLTNTARPAAVYVGTDKALMPGRIPAEAENGHEWPSSPRGTRTDNEHSARTYPDSVPLAMALSAAMVAVKRYSGGTIMG